MDEYDLKRFLTAQEDSYERALKEIRNGHKKSHWIWYIFPQLKGLGYSHNSDYYGISGIAEAQEYLRNEILSKRLKEISRALLELGEDDPVKVMGPVDAKKLKSSMTLFEYVSDDAVFSEVLKRYFKGERDDRTIEMLKEKETRH